jgi:hypothetical protein
MRFLKYQFFNSGALIGDSCQQGWLNFIAKLALSELLKSALRLSKYSFKGTSRFKD